MRIDSSNWADVPFHGLAIEEDTKGLEIMIRRDLEHLIELWDFQSDEIPNLDMGLQFVLAQDFTDRFTLGVSQIK